METWDSKQVEDVQYLKTELKYLFEKFAFLFFLCVAQVLFPLSYTLQNETASSNPM